MHVWGAGRYHGGSVPKSVHCNLGKSVLLIRMHWHCNFQREYQPAKGLETAHLANFGSHNCKFVRGIAKDLCLKFRKYMHNSIDQLFKHAINLKVRKLSAGEQQCWKQMVLEPSRCTRGPNGWCTSEALPNNEPYNANTIFVMASRRSICLCCQF